MRLLLTVLSVLFLSACAAKATIPLQIHMPERADTFHIPVQARGEDGVCPSGARFFLSTQAFKDLQRNIINNEIYIRQLENLLNALGVQ